MLRSRLCDYSDGCIIVNGTITVAEVTAVAPNDANKNIIFKNCAPFTSCISRINNTQIDDAHYIDVAMPMYKLIAYNYNYSKTSGILWQYCTGEPALADNGDTTVINEDNADTNSFKIKEKKTGPTGDNGTKMLK